MAYQGFTLADAKQFLRDWDRQNGSSRGDRQYTRICNDANRELWSTGEWDFAQRNIRMVFNAVSGGGNTAVSVNPGGTTVTGTLTAFSGFDKGSFIRFNGEREQYRILSVVDPVTLEIEGTYLGTLPLAAVPFLITDELRAIPLIDEAAGIKPTFRSVKHALVNAPGTIYGPLYRLQHLPVDELRLARMWSQLVDVPRFYSVEQIARIVSTGPVISELAPHLWVYPPPLARRIVTLFYNVWPGEVSLDTDKFELPANVEGVLREFLLTGLFREQGRMEEYTIQAAKAKSEAVQTIGATRYDNAPKLRVGWTPDVDFEEMGRNIRYWPVLAPGTYLP